MFQSPPPYHSKHDQFIPLACKYLTIQNVFNMINQLKIKKLFNIQN